MILMPAYLDDASDKWGSYQKIKKKRVLGQQVWKGREGFRMINPRIWLYCNARSRSRGEHKLRYSDGN